MCLGVPGQIVDLAPDGHHLAEAEVVGVRRKVNVGLLEGESLEEGDWVLIHVGFAMSKIDAEEADRALEGLRMMGPAYEDEVAAVTESSIE